jgi:predicted anti-sigma-YlaC factor YlaD
MKKDCAYTRKSLRKYLHGHLFKPEQIRVERHLRSCVMCYTNTKPSSRPPRPNSI